MEHFNIEMKLKLHLKLYLYLGIGIYRITSVLQLQKVMSELIFWDHRHTL